MKFYPSRDWNPKLPVSSAKRPHIFKREIHRLLSELGVPWNDGKETLFIEGRFEWLQKEMNRLKEAEKELKFQRRRLMKMGLWVDSK